MPGQSEKDIDEKYLLMTTRTLPFMRAMARFEGNQVALILLNAQEALVRAGEYEAGNLMATLATSALESPEMWRLCVEALDMIAGTATDALKPDLEQKMQEVGLAGRSPGAIMDHLLTRKGFPSKPQDLEEAIYQALRRRGKL